MSPELTPPTVIDLFCGAGGLSLGLGQAGFRTALAVDNWAAAEATFTYNFPETPFLPADAGELTAADLRAYADYSGRPTVVAGGPPCQGFSSAGRRHEEDSRNTLVGTFARLVTELRPAFFLFENVEGFLTAGRGAAIVALLDPLLEAGYQVHFRKVNAANYGVPQLRKRVIAIGRLGEPPTFPEPTHSARGAPGVQLAGEGLPCTPTLGEALADLAHGPSELTDHVRTPLTVIEAARSRALRPGQTMRDLPSNLQHKSYAKRANRRVRDGTPTEHRGGAPSGLRKLRADEPSKAITGVATSEFLHPSIQAASRSENVRACRHSRTTFAFLGARATAPC